MSATVTENPSGNLAADEWYASEEPDPDDETAGQEAPHGWMTDPETGERRPKKAPGRPRKMPTAEELSAAPPLERPPDQPPRPPRKRAAKPKTGDAPDMPDAGFIAAGVNRLYRRAGRIIRALDYDIGQAVIECTRPDPDDPGDLTVGQAWEQLCKTNPRIRRFVLNALAGGAWSDLVMAHAPIGIALFMKPFVQRMIPWGRVVESAAEPDEDAGPGEGGLPGGMTAADVGEMSDLVTVQARRMAERAAAAAGVQVTEAEMNEAVAKARRMMQGQGAYVEHELADDETAGGLPAGLRRQQPKRTTRAQRTGR